MAAAPADRDGPMDHMITRLEACPNCGHAPHRSSAPSGRCPSTPAGDDVRRAVPGARRSPDRATRATAPPAGLSAASVPKILLGLGATCLLVAAVIFLAVAWSWLGIGGRTAVLVGLTATTALAGQWLARRDLGVAAEALTSVDLGLVVLDLFGAENAGWLGTPSDDGFLAHASGRHRSLRSRSRCASRPGALFVPQVAAPLGLGSPCSVPAPARHAQVVATIAMLSFTVLAVGGRALGAVVLPWTSAAGAGLAFIALIGSALTRGVRAPHPARPVARGSRHRPDRGRRPRRCCRGLIVRGHDDLRQLVCAAVPPRCSPSPRPLPVFDEGATAITVLAAASAVAWAVVAGAAPPQWYAVPRVPLAGSLAGAPAGARARWPPAALANLFTSPSRSRRTWLVRLDPAPHVANPLLLPLAVAVIGWPRRLTVSRPPCLRNAVLGIVGLTALLTAALYPLPLIVFVAVLGPFGLVLAFPSAVLTLLVLGEIVAASRRTSWFAARARPRRSPAWCCPCSRRRPVDRRPRARRSLRPAARWSP